jgi:hypothetical protein
MRAEGLIDELALAVGVFPTLQEGMEGVARAVLRKAVRGMNDDKPLALVEIAELLGVSKQGAHQIAAEGGFHCPD